MYNIPVSTTSPPCSPFKGETDLTPPLPTYPLITCVAFSQEKRN